MHALHPWLACVHAHMLEHRVRMSAQDAARFFGEPRGTTAAKLMHSAAGPNGGGWFTAEKQPYEGRDGICYRTIFTAARPQGMAETAAFSVKVRVSSVWQLAGVMR